jgi:hypothetical protein
MKTNPAGRADGDPRILPTPAREDVAIRYVSGFPVQFERSTWPASP